MKTRTILIAVLAVVPLPAEAQQFPPPCVCAPAPDTYALIGLPVVLFQRGLPPQTGTVLVAWPVEAERNPTGQVTRPRSLHVLVEFDAGHIEWHNIIDLRIDVDKRKKQRELMLPQPFPPASPVQPVPPKPQLQVPR